MPKNLGSVKGRWDQIESERKRLEEEKALVSTVATVTTAVTVMTVIA